MIYKKESAGGFNTITAEIKQTGSIIASCIHCKTALIRNRLLLATFFTVPA